VPAGLDPGGGYQGYEFAYAKKFGAVHKKVVDGTNCFVRMESCCGAT